MILETFSSGPLETNTYLIGCARTKQAMVIDVPFGAAAWLIKRAQEKGIQIERILLTHSHWDHVAEVAELKEKLNIPVSIHKEDAGNLEDPGADGLPLLFPVRGVKPDDYLSEGQPILLGDLTIEVLHTPGHTPGGVCFYLSTQRVLFSGDTLFRGAIGNLSLPTARPHLMRASLKKLAALPKQTRVYPGHGEATTIEEEKILKDL